MDSQDASHRRAVRLIVAILLVLVVCAVGYELRVKATWIRQRRAFLAAAIPIGYDNTTVPPIKPEMLPLPAAPPSKFRSLVMSLRNERSQSVIAIACPRQNPKFFATFAGGRFPTAAVEDLDEVKLARRLFPEATIQFHFLTDATTGELLAPQPGNPLVAETR
jgi:hypothetical protein